MIVGRAKELETLKECLAADRSRLIVVYGRRRVGKTFLVREAFDYHFTFTHTGIEDGTLSEQLFGFWTSLREQWDDGCCKPGTWMEAFELLKRAIRHSTDDRKTVFIDELPWMDTRNSGFVKAVEALSSGAAIMSRIYVKSNTLPANMKSALTKRSVFARRLRLSRVKPERTTPVI